jgi:hypothetical protein
MYLNGEEVSNLNNIECKFSIRYLLVMQIYNFCHIDESKWRLLVFGWGNDKYYFKMISDAKNIIDNGKKFYLNKTNDSSKAL